jgi:hypothetical protein
MAVIACGGELHRRVVAVGEDGGMEH